MHRLKQVFFRNKVLVFLIMITLIGLFFYSFRLKETQLFRDDTARDTLRILRIWQNKELTLIGPPVSFTQRTTKEAYLGSLFLYIGLIGLIVANWDPIGAVLPNILFFTLSIPPFYLLVSRLSNSFGKRVTATILYTLSPITVTHARFFWNPNLIIPFSVFFWYFILKKTKDRFHVTLNYFFAGVIAGLMFNFHYLSIVPLLVYAITLLFGKHFFKVYALFSGLIVGVLPMIIFELKHSFYLTSTLIYTLSAGHEPPVSIFTSGLNYFFSIFWSIFGLRQSEIDFPISTISKILNEPILLGITLLIFLAIIIRRKNDKINPVFWPMIVTAFLVTIYFSAGNPIRMRYLFSVYPILIWIIVNFLFRLGINIIPILLFIPVIATSIMIITDKPNLQKSFISLSLIENICQAIIKDNPSGNYNITENLKGDARAMSFRYCVTKNANVKPYDELSYYNLTSLYVVSQSIDKIYKDNRWEFYASGPWRLVQTTDFDEVKLFKFMK